MRIAFVGKGGNGKTTISSLFALYLDAADRRVGLLDVDVNSHTAEVLGVDLANIKELSAPKQAHEIGRFIAASNPRVQSDELLNTTPPGHGSGQWTLDESNFITSNYGNRFGRHSRVFTLGTYTADTVGAGCHHTTQYTAENLLSHARLDDNDVLVIDSVAGNDTFANTLYLQDILLFILKPEREALKVFERYRDLAEKAGVAHHLYVIANQVDGDAQKVFVKKHIPAEMLLGMLPTDGRLIERRLNDEPLDASCLSPDYTAVFDRLAVRLQHHEMSEKERYETLVALHRKVAGEAWVGGAYRQGLEDQIDPEYVPR